MMLHAAAAAVNNFVFFCACDAYTATHNTTNNNNGSTIIILLFVSSRGTGLDIESIDGPQTHTIPMMAWCRCLLRAVFATHDKGAAYITFWQDAARCVLCFQVQLVDLSCRYPTAPATAVVFYEYNIIRVMYDMHILRMIRTYFVPP